MNPESPVAAIATVVGALETMGIPWFLSGSLASSLHGVPRATNDADIVVDLPLGAVSELVRRLGDGYYADEAMIREAFERGAACNIIWLQTMMKVDLSPPRFRFDREALARRQCARLSDGSGASLDVQVASPEDTILSKLHWYMAGHSTSERQRQRRSRHRWRARRGAGSRLPPALGHSHGDGRPAAAGAVNASHWRSTTVLSRPMRKHRNPSANIARLDALIEEAAVVAGTSSVNAGSAASGIVLRMCVPPDSVGVSLPRLSSSEILSCMPTMAPSRRVAGRLPSHRG